MADDPNLIPIDEPFPGDEPVVESEDEAEPEGAVEVAPGRRMVDVSVVAAERRKARETTEKKIRDTELAPLKEKADRADALQQALDAARPYVELVQQNQHLLRQQPAQAPEDAISDAEAEQEARELQLYGADSKLDIKTAKRIIARRRTETVSAAQQAAQQAVAPIEAATAEERSRNNFVFMTQQVDASGQPLVDPQILAQEWVQLPHTLTQDPRVAEVVLERAIGKSVRGGRRPQGPARGPVLSEAPGGQQRQPVTLTENARKLGLSKGDLDASQKTFNPGGASEIGSW